jgi:formamidopyrimidine-DNA glycosylase
VPELPEVEAYRSLATGAVGRPIKGVVVGDPRFVRGSSPRRLRDALRHSWFTSARRIGKLLVLDFEPGGAVKARAGAAARLGLHFGMTGRLLVDGSAGVDHLVYSSERDEPRWDRLTVRFADGGALVVRDPRLLGWAELDPDESALGPDALTVTPAQLRAALDGSAVAVKARLMDQGRLAGVGNLIADEVLWRASLAPQRRAGSLSPAESRRLHRHLRGTLDEMMERGGSHLGDLMDSRAPGGRCPKDGAALVRSTVGGRTSWWCPRHQR